jgi:uncharacterized SAM-binding protein YcdF (DUF218 family)
MLFVLSPAFWIVALFAWSFLTKKDKRRRVLRIIAVSLFVIFSNPFLYHRASLSWQGTRPALPQGKNYSAAILLGGMSMMDRQGNVYFTDNGDRFIQATRLYHSGVVQYVAVAGGSANLFKKTIPESYKIREELLAQAVPADRILTEGRSRNTYENAIYIKQTLDSLKLQPPYILITTASHLPRATAVFRKAGVDVVPYPAAFKEVDSKKTFVDHIVPSVETLGKWSVLLKEIVGLWVYRLTGKA